MNKLRHSPPKTVQTRALVYWYRFRNSLKSKKWWATNGLLIGFWVLLGWPVYEHNLARGIAHTVLAIILAGGRAWRYSGPRQTELVEHEYLARKSRLYALLKKQMYRSEMTPKEVAQFQQDALQLIASYVRGYRADLRGTDIFANLVVEDGEDIVVIARDRDHRLLGARYPKKDMVAWSAIKSGEAAVLGDLRTESPELAKTRRYRSIMAVPIFGDTGEVIGAVSIDSLRPHDFDAECDRLVPRLAPYVCLLGWTLIHYRRSLSIEIDDSSDGGAR